MLNMTHVPPVDQDCPTTETCLGQFMKRVRQVENLHNNQFLTFFDITEIIDEVSIVGLFHHHHVKTFPFITETLDEVRLLVSLFLH